MRFDQNTNIFDATCLESVIQILANRRNAASEVEVTNRTMTYARVALLDQFNLVISEKYPVSKDGIMP